MFAKVHPADDVQAGNTGSCRALAQYLDKEAGEGLRFFSHTDDHVRIENVIERIDSNRKALGTNDAKFFMLSLNPSEAEQKHLIGRDISDISELTEEERRTVYQKLERFTRSAMDEYSRNFGRDKIQSGADLLYYARIETQRLYQPADQAVREGIAKVGEKKPGLQLHVHIIVSRKSRDGKVKLSPRVESTGNSWELEGRGTVKRGFCHENWKVRVQEAFNQCFNYQAKEGDVYQVKQPPAQDKVFSSIPNETLRGLLKDYQFTAANQVIFAMREQGYEHRVRHGLHTFSRDGESFQISHTELKKFERPLSDDQLMQIAKRFDLSKFENTGVYNEQGLQVKEISFGTYETQENAAKSLKNVSYKVIVDEQTKTVVSFATIRHFAFANHVNLIKSDLDKSVILQKMKNADLKDLLTHYRFTAANQIIVAMKERGYEHSVKKGVHVFEHPTRGKIAVLHKDLVRFSGKVNDEVMTQIAERFNLYQFKQTHLQGGYNENGLVSKTIEFKTYVKVPDEDKELQDKAEQTYHKELREVKYEVIYDEQTRTTVPVSQLRHFAYQHGINTMDRYKHSYAVENEDLRECLQNPGYLNVGQINKEMRSRGYQVGRDEEKNYTYTRHDNSFSIEDRDLRAFTQYAKNTQEKENQHRDVGRVAGMVGNNIQNQVMNEILGDNFQTERMIAGNVKKVISIVQNPANVKMMLIRKIGSFLNPFKEL